MREVPVAESYQLTGRHSLADLQAEALVLVELPVPLVTTTYGKAHPVDLTSQDPSAAGQRKGKTHCHYQEVCLSLDPLQSDCEIVAQAPLALAW